MLISRNFITVIGLFYREQFHNSELCKVVLARRLVVIFPSHLASEDDLLCVGTNFKRAAGFCNGRIQSHHRFVCWTWGVLSREDTRERSPKSPLYAIHKFLQALARTRSAEWTRLCLNDLGYYNVSTHFNGLSHGAVSRNTFENKSSPSFKVYV